MHWAIALIFGLTSQLVYGLVNIETYYTQLNSTVHEAEFGWASEQGAEQSSDINGTYQLVTKSDTSRYILISEFQRNQQPGNSVNSQGFAHIRRLRAITPTHFWELFIQKQWNDTLQLDDRSLIGTGIRWLNPIQLSYKIELAIGVGLMLEFEDYRNTPDTTTTRSTNYINLSQEIGQVRLSTIFYYQPNINEFADHRILSRNTLTYNVSDTTYVRFFHHISRNNLTTTVTNRDEIQSGMNVGFRFF